MFKKHSIANKMKKKWGENMWKMRKEKKEGMKVEWMSCRYIDTKRNSAALKEKIYWY